MKENESIGLESRITITEVDGRVRPATVIGFVLGRHQKIRVEYEDGTVELRDDLTNDNIELVQPCTCWEHGATGPNQRHALCRFNHLRGEG